jgi:protein-S-isoprenylcysteine O-methyltransferase Ste14
MVAQAYRMHTAVDFTSPILAPLLILLAVLVYGLVHSLLASLGVKALSRRWLGPQAKRFYRLAYNLFAVFSLLPVLALPAFLPDRLIYVIPLPWSLLTLGLQALALLALAVGVLQTGAGTFLGLRQLFEAPESKAINGETPQGKSPEGESPEGVSPLVVGGLYRWVRHPLYSAGLVFIWLIPRMSVNLLALNFGLSLYLVVGALFEERKLLREFGQAYTLYRQRTPMLVPGLKTGLSKRRSRLSGGEDSGSYG